MRGQSGLFWSEGNTKVKKLGGVCFNLPPVITCPGAGTCTANCYGTQGRFNCPAVKQVRYDNLRIVKATLKHHGVLGLMRDLARDLQAIRQEIVRLHDTGDFFDQDYLDAWLQVAGFVQDKRFYCYTKSLHLNWDEVPDNLKVVQSVGGIYDHLLDPKRPHSKVFGSVAELREAGYERGDDSDRHALLGDLVKIGLVYHGTRKPYANGFITGVDKVATP
jgi:uncharacterized protein YqgQ